MKLGFNKIIKAVTSGGIKTAVIAGGVVVALAIVAVVTKTDEDDCCDEINLDDEIIDVEAEIIDQD